MRWLVLAALLMVALPVSAVAPLSLDLGQFTPPGAAPAADNKHDDSATDPWAWLPRAHADAHFEAVLGNSPGILGLDALATETEGSPTTSPPVIPTGDYPVGWVTAFLGSPRILRMADLDGDGGRDVVAGTDLGVVAVDGNTAQVRWFRPIGNGVRGLEIGQYDGGKGQDVAYATGWGARDPLAAVVSGVTGSVLWQVDLPSPALTIALVPGDKPDMLVATMAGTHVRLAGADGATVWSTDSNLLPSTGAVVAGYFNLGHYLASAGDVNGDGTPDLVSAALVYYYASAPLAVWSFNEFTMLSAVDGATGNMLWHHPIGAEPTADFSFTVLSDLDALDTKGDGSLDIAYTGATMRFDAAIVSYRPFLRVVDGASAVVGTLLGTRETASSQVRLELFVALDHTDVNGDGRDEAVVLRESIVQSLTVGGSLFLERFAFASDPTTAGLMLVLSDISLPFSYGAWLAPTSAAPGARDVAVLMPWADGSVERIDAAGKSVGVREFASQGAMSILDMEGVTVVGTEAGLEFSDHTFAKIGAQTLFFGRPLQIEVVPASGAPVIAVRSSDHAIHVLDPVTGQRMLRTVVPGLNSLHADTHADTGLLFVGSYVQGDFDSSRLMEAWHMPEATVVWSQKYGGYSYGVPGGVHWFDGNGDGIDDALVQAGYAGSGKYSIKAVSGSDGSTLFDAALPAGAFSYYFYQAATVRFGGHAGDDFVLADWRYTWAFEGSTGKNLWKLELDYEPDCMTAADFDADGAEALHYMRYDWRSRDVVIGQVGLDGKAQETALPGDDNFWINCWYAQGPSKTVLVAFASYYGGGKSLAGAIAFDASGIRWSTLVDVREEDATAFTPLAVDATAYGGGRVYGGFGAALRVANLDDGATVTDVSLDVRPSSIKVLDLDHVGDLDFILSTPDGLLRGMGADLKLVVPGEGPGDGTDPGARIDDGVLPGDAVEGGEPGDGGAARPIEADGDGGKTSPDLPTTIVVAALLGLVIRKRRRSA